MGCTAYVNEAHREEEFGLLQLVSGCYGQTGTSIESQIQRKDLVEVTQIQYIDR